MVRDLPRTCATKRDAISVARGPKIPKLNYVCRNTIMSGVLQPGPHWRIRLFYYWSTRFRTEIRVDLLMEQKEDSPHLVRVLRDTLPRPRGPWQYDTQHKDTIQHQFEIRANPNSNMYLKNSKNRQCADNSLSGMARW